MIRESEDLPENSGISPWTRGMSTDLADNQGIPGSINFGPGIFLCLGLKDSMKIFEEDK
jgi:hypothetical protein